LPSFSEGRFRVSVCPHGGGREIAAWAEAIAYLRVRTALPLGWLPAVDFSRAEREAWPQAAVVYADPAAGLALTDKHDFVPVAAATDVDGVFLITARGREASLDAVHGERLAVVPATFAAALGVHTLYQRGLRPRPVASTSWQQVIRRVLSGDCAFGLLCEATYRMLSLRTLRLLHIVTGPWNTPAAHVWLARRAHPLLGLRLEDALLTMHDNAEGRSLLAALGVTGWRRPAGQLEAARPMVAWERTHVRYE